MLRMEEVDVGSMRDPRTVVLRRIHWTVQAEDYWVVAGLQGAGKTDLLMMTAGLMAPRRGRYWLFEEPMPIFEDARLQTRLRLGLVFAGGQLFNHLTVRENVALPLRYHHDLGMAEAAPRVQALLEAMELGPWADSTPGAMGRNWQTRVGLARALILEPEILLLDDPLAGLDPRHANWWLAFLDQLSRGHPLLGGRPVTLVAAAADVRPWKERARQFAVLRNRELVVLGSASEANTAEGVLR